MSLRGLAVFLLALAGLAAGPLHAHARSQSFSSWRLAPGGGRVVVTVAVSEASRLASAGPALESALVDYLTPRLGLASGGAPCTLADGLRPLAARADFLRVEGRFDCSAPGPLTITIDAFFDLDRGHVHYARLHIGDRLHVEQLFTDGERRHQVDAAGAPTSAGFAGYLVLGVEHIAAGADHVAFLIALLLLCRRLREVVLMVTGFTVGHSVTLSLAALGLVAPDVGVIEALIGFTIALVAAENIAVTAHAGRRLAVVAVVGLLGLGVLRALGGVGLPLGTLAGLALFSACYLPLGDNRETAARWRPALTAVFGLIHGFGFASVLLTIGLPGDRLLAALFGFNLGVELGQLAIVGVLWWLGALVPRLLPALDRRLAFDVASAALAGLGLYWFVGRAFAS